MSGNKGTIDEIVDPAAYAQIEKLTGLIVNAKGELINFTSSIKVLNDQLGASKNAKDYEAAAAKTAKALSDMAAAADRAALASAKREDFEKKIATAAEARIKKEQALQDAKTKTIVSDAQKEVDAYNKSSTGAGKLGTVITELSKKEALAASSAASLATNANKLADSSINAAKAEESFKENLSGVDKLLVQTSGSLSENVKQQVKLEIELKAIAKQQKTLKDSFDAGTLSEEKYINATSALTKTEVGLKAALTQASTATRQAAKDANDSTGSYTAMQARLDRLRTSYKDLTAEERKNVDIGGVYLNNIKKLDSELKNIDKDLGQFNRSVGDYGTKALNAATTALVGFFAVSKIKDFVKEIFNVTAEFQKLESVLTNTLGSKSLAQKSLADIQLFAKTTPFGVQEVAGAFVKLANQGFIPTVTQLKKMGDLSASTGKSFDQLAEAILDAQQGQYRRLLELGIRASKQGDNVAVTFKGVTTVIDKSAKSMQNYIVGLGDLEGVTGAAAAISETLGGKVNNLGDAYDQLLLVIGKRLDPIFSNVIDSIGIFLSKSAHLIESYDQKLNRAQSDRIQREVDKRKKADDDAIKAMIDQGVKVEDAQRKIYSEQAALQEDLFQKDETRIKQRQASIAALYKELSDINPLTTNAKEKTSDTQAKIKENEDDLYRLQYDLKKRTILKDDYNAKIASLDKAAMASEVALTEKQQKELDRIAKQELDDDFNLKKQRLEIQKNNAKAIEDNEKNSLESRLAAQEVYGNRELDLLNLIYKHDLAQKDISNTKKLQLEEKYNNDLILLEEKNGNERAKIVIQVANKELESFNSTLSQRNNNIAAAGKKELDLISINRDKEIAALDPKDDKYMKNRKGAENKFQQEIQDIRNKYAIQYIHQEISNIETTISAYADSVKEIEGYEKQLSDYKKSLLATDNATEKSVIQTEIDNIQIKLEAEKAAYAEKTDLEVKLAALKAELNQTEANDINHKQQEQTQKIQKYLQGISEITQQSFTTLSAFSDAYYQRQINDISATQKSNDARYTAEQNAINNSTLSAQEKATKLALLDKKKAAQDEQLAKRQAQADIAKAKRDREIQIGNIIANTAIAVVSQLSIPGAGLGLAAAAAAVGALQLAAVLAQPLPSYEKGGIKYGSGLARVSEKGRELVYEADGTTWLTPNQESIVHINDGARIISHPETERLIANQTLSPQILERNNIDLSKLINSDKENTRTIVNALKNKAPIMTEKNGLRTYKTSA